MVFRLYSKSFMNMSEVKLTGKTDFDLDKKINFTARDLFCCRPTG